jgi:hypothetical protein
LYGLFPSKRQTMQTHKGIKRKNEIIFLPFTKNIVLYSI